MIRFADIEGPTGLVVKIESLSIDRSSTLKAGWHSTTIRSSDLLLEEMDRAEAPLKERSSSSSKFHQWPRTTANAPPTDRAMHQPLSKWIDSTSHESDPVGYYYTTFPFLANLWKIFGAPGGLVTVSVGQCIVCCVRCLLYCGRVSKY